MDSENGDDREGVPPFRRRLNLEDFLVDFLGGLVPGLLFLCAAGIALLPPLNGLIAVLTQRPVTPIVAVAAGLLKASQRTPSALWAMSFFGGMLVAYVIGHLFYRHDVKEADKKSFERLAMGREEEWLKNNLACATPEECEFPYPDLHMYLRQRGLDYLVPFVVWGAEGRRRCRSKNYINSLKIRLRYYHPERCGAMTRNEAHVRLASSTWYVAKLLRIVGGLGLVIASTAIAKDCFTLDPRTGLGSLVTGGIFPLLVVVFSLYAMSTISSFLHYQRLREVFFVLETAFTAFRGQYDLLEPPFDAVAIGKRTDVSQASELRAANEPAPP